MIKADKIFLPVSVDERLPKGYHEESIFVELKETGKTAMRYNGEGSDSRWKHIAKYWLEEQRNVIVLTEAEFEEEKKKEAIAALEFVKNGYGTVLDKKLNAVWQSLQDQSPLYTTEQLYQLFKTKQ